MAQQRRAARFRRRECERKAQAKAFANASVCATTIMLDHSTLIMCLLCVCVCVWHAWLRSTVQMCAVCKFVYLYTCCYGTRCQCLLGGRKRRPIWVSRIIPINTNKLFVCYFTNTWVSITLWWLRTDDNSSSTRHSADRVHNEQIEQSSVFWQWLSQSDSLPIWLKFLTVFWFWFA